MITTSEKIKDIYKYIAEIKKNMKEWEKRIGELEIQNINIIDIILEIIYSLDPITQSWLLNRAWDKINLRINK